MYAVNSYCVLCAVKLKEIMSTITAYQRASLCQLCLHTQNDCISFDSGIPNALNFYNLTFVIFVMQVKIGELRAWALKK